MLTSYATAVVALGVILAGWLVVQRAWQRVFPDATADPDALAGRLGCHGCGCTDTCRRDLDHHPRSVTDE